MEIKQSFLNKARKDKFKLVFDVPPILKTISTKYNRNNSTIVPDSVQFSIFGTMVPEITVPAVEARYAGSNLYVSSHGKNPYPPVNVKFAVDEQYNNYWTIYQWLNLLHDQKTGRYNQKNIQVDKSFSDYQTDLTVIALDSYDNPVIKFKYTKAFPTTIDQLEFDQQTTGEMELISGFTFVYSQMHAELIGGSMFNAENLDI